jgi:hypothetical protein
MKGNQKDFNIVGGNMTIIGSEKEKHGTGDPGQEKKPLKRILILSANPVHTPHLRLNREIREIKDGLKRSSHRDTFDIQVELAVGFWKFRRALLDYEPQIVHFVGHGEEEGILVEDKMGFAEPVSPEVLAGLFELFSHQVECVVLGACHSEPQADAIAAHIDYVIGMQREIKDKAAIEFSVGFYDALGAGRNVEDAFKLGRIAIMQNYPELPEYQNPVLKKRKG